MTDGATDGPPSAGPRLRGGPRRRAVLLALAAAALVLAGCAAPDQSGTLPHRVSVWASTTSFGETVGTLEADTRSVDGVIRLHRGPGAIHTACGVLETDAATAESNLPTPDARLTGYVDRAATLDFRAGTDCYNGGGTDAKLMARSARERAQARAALTAAVARVQQLTHHVLSTTTTTEIGGGAAGGL
jgi:hypothetical protein